jgi:uncharacterized membrane protein (DUF106 family)
MGMVKELLISYPRLSIIFLGIVVSLFITIVQKYFGNQKRMKELKKQQKDLQERMKEHQKNGNHEKVLELQKEMFSQVGETFKHSLKPMLITFLPLIILFWWLRDIYNPVLGGWWIAYYIGGSLVSSIIFRKIFKVA